MTNSNELWIDRIDDTEIELLGMSDEELDTWAYAHAESLTAPPKRKAARRAGTATPPHTLPQAA